MPKKSFLESAKEMTYSVNVFEKAYEKNEVLEYKDDGNGLIYAKVRIGRIKMAHKVFAAESVSIYANKNKPGEWEFHTFIPSVRKLKGQLSREGNKLKFDADTGDTFIWPLDGPNGVDFFSMTEIQEDPLVEKSKKKSAGDDEDVETKEADQEPQEKVQRRRGRPKVTAEPEPVSEPEPEPAPIKKKIKVLAKPEPTRIKKKVATGWD